MKIKVGAAAERMKKQYTELSDSKKNCIWSFLVTAIAVAILWHFFPPRFTETNDDLIMACFTYGYMGDYSARLVFINILIGYVLKLCMMILPSIPWYAVMQIALLFVSFWVITYLIFQKFGRTKGFIPVLLLLAFFGYQFFCSLQFTKTAASGVIAGFMLLFYAASEHRKWYTYVFAGLLALAGGLYRFRVFELMLIVAFGVGLLLVWRALRAKAWKQIMLFCIPFAILIVASFGCDMFDDWQYNRVPEWKNYAEFNRLRASLMDRGFPDYDENLELYESLDISRNDYLLYNSSNIGDTELFTTDVMQALVKAKKTPEINQEFFQKCWETISKGMLNYSFFPMLIIAIVIGAIGFKRKRGAAAFLTCYEILAFLGVQIYFFYRNRYLQGRVDASIIFAICVILILYVWDEKWTMPDGKRVVAGFACVAVLATLPWQYPQYLSDAEEMEEGNSTQVRELIASDPAHFYFYCSAWQTFPDKMYDIWNVAEKGCGSNCSAMGTWRVSTPTVIDKMERYDITNPYRDLIDNHSVYLLCVANQSLNQVLTHIRVHYNQDAYAYQVKSIEGYYPIYRIATGEPQLDTSMAVDATDYLHYDLTRWEQDGLLYLDGYLYADDTNSFASNIYVGIIGPDGTETFYYTTQYQSSFTEDNMNGEYGSFTRGIPMPEEGRILNLYLETEDGLYVVPNWYAMPDV